MNGGERGKKLDEAVKAGQRHWDYLTTKGHEKAVSDSMLPGTLPAHLDTAMALGSPCCTCGALLSCLNVGERFLFSLIEALCTAINVA